MAPTQLQCQIYHSLFSDIRFTTGEFSDVKEPVSAKVLKENVSFRFIPKRVLKSLLDCTTTVSTMLVWWHQEDLTGWLSWSSWAFNKDAIGETQEDRLSSSYYYPELPLEVWRFTVKTTQTGWRTNKPKTTLRFVWGRGAVWFLFIGLIFHRSCWFTVQTVEIKTHTNSQMTEWCLCVFSDRRRRRPRHAAHHASPNSWLNDSPLIHPSKLFFYYPNPVLHSPPPCNMRCTRNMPHRTSSCAALHRKHPLLATLKWVRELFLRGCYWTA